MLLMTDPRFQLFRQFLWGQGSETVNYSKLKELNRQLIYLNLSADCKIGGLLGESGLIFLLQLRYLRDFYYFEEAEIFQQMEQYHQRSPMIPISKELFPDDKSLKPLSRNLNCNPSLLRIFILIICGITFKYLLILSLS